MNTKISMRDSFWNRIYDLAKKDKNIMLVDGDMGAPSLDKFRKDLNGQYFSVGIAEHNMIAIASGLAKEGKKVFTYAIAPFITSRCHEFTKLNCGLMKIPIKLVGVGAGFSYDDSGPTHHTTEDITIMRAIPNLEIYSPSDSSMASELAENICKSDKPVYIRLDREIHPNLSQEGENFEKGFRELKEGENVAIIATGNLVHKALEVHDYLINKGIKVGVIDLYKLKPLPQQLNMTLAKYKKIISIEEHILDGGFGSIIAETIVDNDLDVKLKRIGLKSYIYAYGGRENIRKSCGIDIDSIIKKVSEFIN